MRGCFKPASDQSGRGIHLPDGAYPGQWKVHFEVYRPPDASLCGGADITPSDDVNQAGKFTTPIAVQPLTRIEVAYWADPITVTRLARQRGRTVKMQVVYTFELGVSPYLVGNTNQLDLGDVMVKYTKTSNPAEAQTYLASAKRFLDLTHDRKRVEQAVREFAEVNRYNSSEVKDVINDYMKTLKIDQKSAPDSGQKYNTDKEIWMKDGGRAKIMDWSDTVNERIQRATRTSSQRGGGAGMR